MTQQKNPPQIVVRDGKATAVILDIDEYEQMLERLEELDDLAALQSMRQAPLEFRKLDEFLNERSAGV